MLNVLEFIKWGLKRCKRSTVPTGAILPIPADWQEDIQRRVDERIAAEGLAEEQDIPAEEALDILLGGAT